MAISNYFETVFLKILFNISYLSNVKSPKTLSRKVLSVNLTKVFEYIKISLICIK